MLRQRVRRHGKMPAEDDRAQTDTECSSSQIALPFGLGAYDDGTCRDRLLAMHFALDLNPLERHDSLLSHDVPALGDDEFSTRLRADHRVIGLDDDILDHDPLVTTGT